MNIGAGRKTLRPREKGARPSPHGLEILGRDRSFTLASPVCDRTVSRHQKSNSLEAACKGVSHRSRLKVFPVKEIIMKPFAILGVDIAKAKFDVCLQLAQGGVR